MSPLDRADTTTSPTDAISAALLEVVSGLLRELHPRAPPRSVRLDDGIERDLGLDSLSRVELVARIERAFNVRLPEQAAIAARTPRELLEAVVAAAPAPLAPPHEGVIAPPPAAVVGVPDTARTIVEAFRWHLERHPEREHVTLTDGDATLETLSYADLWSAAEAVGGGLRALGIGSGDKVALMLPTGSAFFEAFLGAMLAGAVPVPLYPPVRWEDIEDHVKGRAAILANAGARVLVTVPQAMFVGRVARATLPELRAIVTVDRLRAESGERAIASAAGDDTAMLQYTSGSTGDPKGVVLSHDNLLANIRAMGKAAQPRSSDRFVSWLPLYHDMGLIGAWLGTMYFAVPLVVMPPTSFLARPPRWLWTIHRYRGTISAGPNFAYEIAASKIRDEDLQGLDLRSWRLAFNGAEPVRAATLERFAARFAPYGFDRGAMLPVYGLAETAVGLAFPPLGRGPLVERVDESVLAREGRAVRVAPDAAMGIDVVSCGVPLPDHELRVVDERGREVPARSEGRVEFRGPAATAGYYRNPEATARLFRNGWLDTGDVGYIANGELFLTSRAKDLIKRGGHNLHPYDLEAAVGDIPGIRKGCVAVFGTADLAVATERVIVVAETIHTDTRTREALRDRIMALASLHLDGPADEVLLVPPRTVLKTSSGKIRRAACRELYEKGLLTAPRRAVWLQMARLLARAAQGTVRRALLALAQLAYGAWAWLALAALAIAGAVPILFHPMPRTRRKAARILARLLMRACAVPLKVEGLGNLAPGRQAVIAINHASYVDALVVLATLGIDLRFVAKREFARMPLFGFVLRRLGTRFVERVDPAAGVEDTRDIEGVVARGETLAFFPEGTFSRAPGLGAFRLGAFVVAASADTPIVPVVLQGTRSVLRAGQWLPTRHPVGVTVLSPMSASGRDWSAAVHLRGRVRSAMLAVCGEPDLAG